MKRHYISAKTVNGLLPKILQKVVKGRGFPAMALISDWPVIAGAELAAYCQPERLSWPRRAQEVFSAEHGGAPGADLPGATLRLRVEPVMALEVDYQKTQILERINTYFGYRAVTSLKIIQGPVRHASAAAATKPAPKLYAPVQSAKLPDVEDPKLRDALARLNKSRQRKG